MANSIPLQQLLYPTGAVRRRGVESVEVAGRLLQAMVRLGGKSRLTVLAEATGIPAAKVHRYLVSLQAVGLLRQDPDTHEYGLGPLCFQLGEISHAGADVVDMVAPYVADFSRQVREACGVAIWQPEGVTIVRWFGVHREVSITLRPRTVVNITTSCTGCVCAAYLSRELTEPLVRADLDKAGKFSEAAVEGIYRSYREIRRIGIASSRGTRILGINGLSVPVFNRLGECAMAVTMLGHESTFDASVDGPQAHALKRLSEHLTSMLGGSYVATAPPIKEGMSRRNLAKSQPGQLCPIDPGA